MLSHTYTACAQYCLLARYTIPRAPRTGSSDIAYSPATSDLAHLARSPFASRAAATTAESHSSLPRGSYASSCFTLKETLMSWVRLSVGVRRKERKPFARCHLNARSFFAFVHHMLHPTSATFALQTFRNTHRHCRILQASAVMCAPSHAPAPAAALSVTGSALTPRRRYFQDASRQRTAKAHIRALYGPSKHVQR